MTFMQCFERCALSPDILAVPQPAQRACFKQRRHRGNRCQRRSQLFRLRAAEGEDASSGPDSTESLFLKELRRRGLSSPGSREDGQDSPTPTSTSTREPSQPGERPSRPFDRSQSQLEKSRALNSEGIEGIIPRLTELAKLGLSFFLGFAPLILALVLVYAGIFWLFGENFIHGGRSGAGIPYIDPRDLLNEPTVDPMIPFR